jgi:hypothetical protein
MNLPPLKNFSNPFYPIHGIPILFYNMPLNDFQPLSMIKKKIEKGPSCFFLRDGVTLMKS